MNTFSLLAAAAALGLLAAALRPAAWDRLLALDAPHPSSGTKHPRVTLPALIDPLGRAGLVERGERHVFLASAVGGCVLSSVAAGVLASRIDLSPLIGAVLGLSLGALGVQVSLHRRQRAYSARMVGSLPLTLESLILLVQSGLSVLPAIAACAAQMSSRDAPALRFFTILYDRTITGQAITDAVEEIAAALPYPAVRHVLLHLDIAGAEGCSIADALRSLSDYAHAEWRAGVEERVRRLENVAVFPVFAAVIGLFCLVVAVPLVRVQSIRSGLVPATGSIPAATPLTPPEATR